GFRARRCKPGTATATAAPAAAATETSPLSAWRRPGFGATDSERASTLEEACPKASRFAWGRLCRETPRLIILSAAKDPTTQFRPHNLYRTSHCDCEVPHPERIRG